LRENLGIEYKADVAKRIADCGRIVLEEMPNLIPGARDLVDWISANCRAALVTRGDRTMQLRKLTFANLDRCFEFLDVVPEKNGETFKTLFSKLGVSAKEAWVIGD